MRERSFATLPSRKEAHRAALDAPLFGVAGIGTQPREAGPAVVLADRNTPAPVISHSRPEGLAPRDIIIIAVVRQIEPRSADRVARANVSRPVSPTCLQPTQRIPNCPEQHLLQRSRVVRKVPARSRSNAGSAGIYTSLTLPASVMRRYACTCHRGRRPKWCGC